MGRSCIRSSMAVIAPSPLVGEGMYVADQELAWVRGLSPRIETPHPALRATFSHKGRREEKETYRGAMRIAPSRRMVSPFSIGFSTMCTASEPYSLASPRREG